jgi:Flp pilus assembly pilin Flp
MNNLLRKLWSDDAGALIAAEYLFVATILVIGVIVGLATVRDAVTTELAELANAYLTLSQGYTISGLTGCCSSVDGSAAIDTATTTVDVICTAPTSIQAIDQLPCD